MKEFNMTPSQWQQTTSLDKRILHYHRVMEGHYLDLYHEKMERESKMKQSQQELMSKMPKQLRRGR